MTLLKRTKDPLFWTPPADEHPPSRYTPVNHPGLPLYLYLYLRPLTHKEDLFNVRAKLGTLRGLIRGLGRLYMWVIDQVSDTQ